MLKKFELWLYYWEREHEETFECIVTIIFTLIGLILTGLFWKYILPLFQS